MRKIIEQTEDGEKTILVFRSQQEREEFFRRARSKTKIEHTNGVGRLLRAYRESVAKLDAAFKQSRAELDEFEKTSLLESETEPVSGA